MLTIRKTLTRAVIRVLYPLVRILLRYEISHSEFTEISRRAYVKVAFKYFSIPKRIKSISRVSVITGLSRKEVVRLAALELDEPPETNGPTNRAHRVVNGWLQDPEFLDQDKRPRALSLRDGSASFEALVKRYSGGITARAVLDELQRVGTVHKLDKQTVQLNHYGYLPERSDDELVNLISTHVADLLTTCEFNITRAQTEAARFQRQVTYVDIPESLALAFQAYSHEKLENLSVEMNQWLFTHKKEMNADTGEPSFRLGVGAYFFLNEKQGE